MDMNEGVTRVRMSFSLKNKWDYSIMNCNLPNPDKPEPEAEKGFVTSKRTLKGAATNYKINASRFGSRRL
jgi:hypothetical protein